LNQELNKNLGSAGAAALKWRALGGANSRNWGPGSLRKQQGSRITSHAAYLAPTPQPNDKDMRVFYERIAIIAAIRLTTRKKWVVNFPGGRLFVSAPSPTKEINPPHLRSRQAVNLHSKYTQGTASFTCAPDCDFDKFRAKFSC